jgi:hypothetical protein
MRSLSKQRFEELVTLLAEEWVRKELHEAAHPTDGRDYPLLPSRDIDAPRRHDAPYQITTVILPMEEDQSKWN